MGVASPLLNIFAPLLPLSLAINFPFDPWTSKILIDQNRLQKNMYLGIDVTYMHTNFGGRGLSGFGDIATFKNGQIPLSTHGL